MARGKKDVIFRMDAETGKAVVKIMQVANAMKSTEKATGKLVRQSKTAKTEMQRFGDDSSRQMRNLATSVVSVGAAIGTVTAMFAKMSQEAQVSVQRMTETATSTWKFVQLAKGDPKLLAELFAMEKTVRRQGVIEPGVSAEIVFTAASSGLLQYSPVFGGLQAAYGDTAALIAATNAVRKAGIGTNVPRIIAQGEVASGKAFAQVPGLMTAAALAGAQMKGIGGTYEEALAGTAIISEIIGAQSAGKSMRQLAMQMGKRRSKLGLTGTDFTADLRKMMAQNWTPEEMATNLGEVRAGAAFTYITGNWEKYIETRENLRGVTGEALQRTLDVEKAIPLLNLERQYRVAQAGEQLAWEARGEYAKKVDILRARRRELHLRRETFAPVRWFEDWMLAMRGWMGEPGPRPMGAFGGGPGFDVNEELERVAENLRKLNEELERSRIGREGVE